MSRSRRRTSTPKRSGATGQASLAEAGRALEGSHVRLSRLRTRLCASNHAAGPWLLRQVEHGCRDTVCRVWSCGDRHLLRGLHGWVVLFRESPERRTYSAGLGIGAELTAWRGGLTIGSMGMPTRLNFYDNGRWLASAPVRVRSTVNSTFPILS